MEKWWLAQSERVRDEHLAQHMDKQKRFEAVGRSSLIEEFGGEALVNHTEDQSCIAANAKSQQIRLEQTSIPRLSDLEDESRLKITTAIDAMDKPLNQSTPQTCLVHASAEQEQ